MTVRVYSSSDTGAPVLRGQSGSLLGVLDACLVNGYGSFTSAGWTKPYSTGTTIGVYRQPSGNGMYLRVDDTGSGTGFVSTTIPLLARARVSAYETMSAVSTGTGQFPSVAQMPNYGGSDGATGLYMQKSITGDTYIRRWVLVATQKMFHLWIDTNSNIQPTGYTTASTTLPWGDIYTFGDINSFYSGDAYATMLAADTTFVSADTTGYATTSYASSFNTASTGNYLARSFTQFGSSIQMSRVYDTSRANQAVPSVVDGGLWIIPYYAVEANTNGIIRGTIPGLWRLGHAHTAFQFGDTVTGTGTLAGKTFMVVSANTTRNWLLEISNTW